MSLSLKWNIREFLKASRLWPEMVRREVAEGLDEIGARHVRAMGDRFVPYTSGGVAGVGDDGKIHSRTGSLSRAGGYEVSQKSKGEESRLLIHHGDSITADYVYMQEFGDTVKAKNKLLTIPLPDNLTPAGVPRYPSAAQLKREQPGSTFVLRSPDGRMVIGYQPEGATEILWLWRLAREVTIQPRLGFFKTFKEGAETRGRILNRVVKNVVGRFARVANRGKRRG